MSQTIPPPAATSSTKSGKAALTIAPILLLAAGLLYGVRAIIQIESARHEAAPVQSVPATAVAAANPPVSIAIPALSITNAPVVRLSLNADGSLQTPAGDNSDRVVGWYGGGAAPGDIGTAIMVGHLDSAVGPAIFWHLKNLKPGDTISITRSDGSTVQFAVDRSARYGVDNFPDREVYGATSYPSLRLLTCSGVYDRQTHHYTDNLVVYATLR